LLIYLLLYLFIYLFILFFYFYIKKKYFWSLPEVILIGDFKNVSNEVRVPSVVGHPV